jgi:hypothetical protein
MNKNKYQVITRNRRVIMFNKSKNITNLCSCNLFIFWDNYLTATALHDHCASNTCAVGSSSDGFSEKCGLIQPHDADATVCLLKKTLAKSKKCCFITSFTFQSPL